MSSDFMPSNQKLTPEQQTFIVQALACFDSPKTVADAVKAEFGVEVSRQLVEVYDPLKPGGGLPARKWVKLFEETRAKFLADQAAIGISHRVVRLRSLDRMARRAEEQGNLRLAADMAKQAAEEVGGVYTNRREVTGKDGAAVEMVTRIERVIVDPANPDAAVSYVDTNGEP